ncbi:hypothetical protein AHAS_Ahas01G0159700 [Arachis hypogaea]
MESRSWREAKSRASSSLTPEKTRSPSPESRAAAASSSPPPPSPLPCHPLHIILTVNDGDFRRRSKEFHVPVLFYAHEFPSWWWWWLCYGAGEDERKGGGSLIYCMKLPPHGSLSSVLYEKLNWSLRFKIILGTAEELCYLHERCQRRIIHKDIKAFNILLSETFEPQLSDFGLAKWLPDLWTHHTVSKVEGTFGYLIPGFFMHGIVDEKTDVYAYGVLLLELITGRQALDSSQKSLIMWAKPLIDAYNVKELVDPSLGEDYDRAEK